MSRIFHYTTIENLELILSNRTIRLSSLSQMDDISEGDSYDFGSLAKYFYVSSWTDDKEESIPLWHMYTNEMRGVRIEADFNFLKITEEYPSNRIITPVFKHATSCRINHVPVPEESFNVFLPSSDLHHIAPRFAFERLLVSRRCS